MTTRFQLQARQEAPGAPITVDVNLGQEAEDDPYPQNVRLGVTTTSTPPATYSALTYSIPAGNTATLWDSADEQLAQRIRGGVVAQYTDTNRNRALLRVDSNFAAGRYLWLAAFAAGTPSAGDAPTYLAGPYLIR